MSCPSHLGVSKNRGTFFHGWFIVVPNPMNKWDDLGGFSHLFLAENRLLCPENFGHAGTDDAQFPDCAGLGVSRAHSGGSHLFGGELKIKLLVNHIMQSPTKLKMLRLCGSKGLKIFEAFCSGGKQVSP